MADAGGSLMRTFAEWLIARASRRKPNVVIGPGGDLVRNPNTGHVSVAPDYLKRWFIIPRNRWFNIYLHRFGRSDEDRALHDHPWLFNCSFVLDGKLAEYTIDRGGIGRCHCLWAGDWRFRWGPSPHRLELWGTHAWTLFITGPRIRDWGFHCPREWVPWQKFTDPTDAGRTGHGCDQ